MRIGSLFSGAGGLDMAIQAVFGDAEVRWHSELDAAASKVLRHRWPDVQNLGDITTVEWNRVYDEMPIDVLCGGWPCQPFSLAGKRKGIEDERALWPHVAGAIRALRPRYVVLENVSAVLRSPEFNRVANSLAENGYDMQWTCLRASDVGAAHRRERLFIVAHTSRAGLQGTRPGGDAPQQPEYVGDSGPTAAVDLLPTPCAQQSGNTPENHLAKKPGRKVVTDLAILVENGLLQTGGVLLPTPAAADGNRGQDFARANRDGSGGDDLVTLAVKATRDSQWGKYAPAIARWEQVAGPAPSPTEPNTKGNPRLSPAFSEWLMGWPAGHVTAVPGISRNDQLRIIGNGVVPQQAEAAIRYLLTIAEAAA